jgi:transposase
VNPPTRKFIYQWDKTLRETGSLVSRAGKHHKQHVTEVIVDRVRESFCKKSIRRASRELGVPRSTVNKILHKRLRLHGYILPLHYIKPADHCKRTDFAVEMLSRIEENESYLDFVLLSDESTYHVCGESQPA